MTFVAVAGSIPAPCHGDNGMSEGSLTFIFSSKKYWVKLLILTSLGSFLISGMIVRRLHSTPTPSQNVKCWWNYFYFTCESNSRNGKHWSASQKITLLFFNYKTFLPCFLERYSSHVRKFIKKTSGLSIGSWILDQRELWFSEFKTYTTSLLTLNTC